MSLNILDCELEYIDLPHLYQIYYGFFLLEKKGFIKLNLIKKNSNIPLAKLKLTLPNGKQYLVIYDTLDGLNWLDGTLQDNLKYFSSLKYDFYFKRSYTKELLKFVPKKSHLLPLGLFYRINPTVFDSTNPTNLIRFILNKYKYRRIPNSKIFEDLPQISSNPKILFMTRLWNPNQITNNNSLQDKIKKINEMRINSIVLCKQEFGDIFFGGLQDNTYTQQVAQELVIPKKDTKRKNYLNLIKKHEICIATTGLHNSIGGKIAEYVSASRAIVSEPLHYDLPGNFQNNKNYLEFTDNISLLKNLNFLLKNSSKRYQLMIENYHYYNSFLRDEQMVLNTIFEIIKND